jgi:hypothetical protein
VANQQLGITHKPCGLAGCNSSGICEANRALMQQGPFSSVLEQVSHALKFKDAAGLWILYVIS